MDDSFFNLYASCDDEKLRKSLLGLSSLQSFKKGDIILGMGERQEWIYFLYSGIACAYSLEHDGTEVVDCIMDKKGMPVMPSACLNEPSPFFIEALSDCTLTRINLQQIENLRQTHAGAASLFNSFLSKAWLDHHELESALRRLPARQRYEWFLTSYPNVIDAIPHSKIASFLGMSPVTLSRIRNTHSNLR